MSPPPSASNAGKHASSDVIPEMSLGASLQNRNENHPKKIAIATSSLHDNADMIGS
jgi:hypothetical protein